MVSMTEPQTLLKADDVSIVVKAEKAGKALRVTARSERTCGSGDALSDGTSIGRSSPAGMVIGP